MQFARQSPYPNHQRDLFNSERAARAWSSPCNNIAKHSLRQPVASASTKMTSCCVAEVWVGGLLLVGHRGRVCKRVEEGCVGQALSFYTPCLQHLQILPYFGEWPQNNSPCWRLPAGSSTGSEAHGKPKSYPAHSNIWTSPTRSRENSKNILRWQDYYREAHGK